MKNGYVDLLLAELVRRKGVNRRYSERAFAQAVGLSPGFLKLLFQGKRRLSVSRGQDIANRLGWTESKKAKFLSLVLESDSKAARSLKGKLLIDSHDFFEISDWFYFAIVEYVKVKKGAISRSDICEQFGLSKTEADFAIKQLLRLKILASVRSGTYRAVDEYEVPSISNAGIRKYHKQILTMARDSVDQQSIEERDLRSLTLSFSIKRMVEAKREIQKFVSNFERKFGVKHADSVYQLSLALFRLNKKGKS